MRLGYVALAALLTIIAGASIAMALTPTRRVEQIVFHTYPFVALLLAIVAAVIILALLAVVRGERE